MRYNLSLESDEDSITGPSFDIKEEALDYARKQVNGMYRYEKGYSVVVYDQKANKTIFVKPFKKDITKSVGKKNVPTRKVGAKYRVRHVVEKIGATQVNQTRRQLEQELKQQRAWMLLAKDSATNAKARAKAAKELAENKRELKAISGRKKAGPKRRRSK